MNFANGGSNPSSPDPSLAHLGAEMHRLDLRLARQIARWRAAGQDPTDAFRGLYISDEEADGLLQRPLGGSWADHAGVDPKGFQAALAAAKSQSLALASAAAAQGSPVRLQVLEEKFRLSAFETNVVLLALAPSLDLRYQRIYGYLQDDVTRKLPAVNLALDLFSSPENRPGLLAHFDPGATLYRQMLLLPDDTLPVLARPLQIDPAVAAWLIGNYTPDNLIACETAAGFAEQTIDLPIYHPGLIVSLTGPDREARHQAARQLSARCEKPLLKIDLSKTNENARLKALRKQMRDALLLDAVPLIIGWDSAAKDQTPPPDLMQAVLDHPDMVVISSFTTWRASGLRRSRRIHHIAFPIPGYPQRLSQWRRLLKDHPGIDQLDLAHLAGQFALTTDQILDAHAAARDEAAQRGEKAPDDGELLAAARAHSNPRLGALARKIDPRFSWEDIVLPEEQITILHEITATVRQRPRVLDDWGVGNKLASSRGVTVLFAGPPGTGKTMAAEIMAADLGLDLYKIDLSGVVSKYIGETEKNLEKVFEEAATSNAILFFDEADSLFGKRSEVRDAHDRYANLEISYLLQRMEAYDGVTILATNLRANLDEAFTRRLQFAVDFPFPEEEYRLRIWKALLPPELPVSSEIDFTLLAGRFRIAGGNIRNVIVNAAYLAAADGGTVTMQHMLHGTRRELQKMGRLLDDENLVREYR